jgi:hypothetical protein
VSARSTPAEQEAITRDGSRAIDPFHNPSYPARTHYHERDELERSLRSALERINKAHQKLSSLAGDPRAAVLVRLYHQMLGARDQIAACVRRMPLETGELYEGDRERYAQAVAALERTWQKWQAGGG